MNLFNVHPDRYIRVTLLNHIIHIEFMSVENMHDQTKCIIPKKCILFDISHQRDMNLSYTYATDATELNCERILYYYMCYMEMLYRGCINKNMNIFVSNHEDMNLILSFLKASFHVKKKI